MASPSRIIAVLPAGMFSAPIRWNGTLTFSGLSPTRIVPAPATPRRIQPHVVRRRRGHIERVRKSPTRIRPPVRTNVVFITVCSGEQR
jgi:hypothetical protein